MELEQLAHELTLASSEQVMPSSDRGIYIPELGKRIFTMNQLTCQQCASLSEDQLLQVFRFMANFPSMIGASLAHRGGRR